MSWVIRRLKGHDMEDKLGSWMNVTLHSLLQKGLKFAPKIFFSKFRLLVRSERISLLKVLTEHLHCKKNKGEVTGKEKFEPQRTAVSRPTFIKSMQVRESYYARSKFL